MNIKRRLTVYYIKDAYLILKLKDKLMILFNYTEMSRVTSTPFKVLLTRGNK